MSSNEEQTSASAGIADVKCKFADRLAYVETNLHVLARLQAGEKLAIDENTNFVIDSPNVLQPIYRYLYGNSRDETLKRLEAFIECISEVVKQLTDEEQFSRMTLPIGCQRMMVFSSLLGLIRNAVSGLHNLKSTYAQDETTGGRILSLTTSLENIVSHIQKQFPSDDHVIISIPTDSQPLQETQPQPQPQPQPASQAPQHAQAQPPQPQPAEQQQQQAGEQQQQQQQQPQQQQSPPKAKAHQKTITAAQKKLLDDHLSKLKSMNLQPQLLLSSILSMAKQLKCIRNNDEDIKTIETLVYSRGGITADIICQELGVVVTSSS
jgi:DNA segregation ATPase FtsK/SpoIIIE-like protein